MTDNVFLGIDLGIGSCGWAVAADDHLVGMGARTFDVPETSKERTPTNQLRRVARGLRRVTRRRRQRMNDLRDLLLRHGLLEDDGKDALAGGGDAPDPTSKRQKELAGSERATEENRPNPWQARAEGLDRALSPRELALALGHIAKHRGFKSNSKRDRGANAPAEQSKMLAAVAKMQDASTQWRSIGEMFWKSEEFQSRKRNQDGDYSRSVLRADLELEVRKLLRSQRKLGNTLATEELENDFIDIAFFQRPLADSEHMVGFCSFEPAEKRAPKHAPSFEMFRLLTRLTNLRINGRALLPEEITAASCDFGHQQGLTFKRLRGILGLSAEQRFDGVPVEEEGKRDAIARSGKPFPGSAALYKALGEAAWQSLRKTPEVLDRVAAILAFRDDTGSILTGLRELDLPQHILDALLHGVEDGVFSAFKGAGHISAKACRALSPYLAKGLDYSEACKKVPGYDHAARPETDIESIGNPIAKKALREALKQIKAVIEKHGKPTHIHVELAREVGKSLEERQEIEAGIEKRNKAKERLRDQFRIDVGRDCAGPEDLMRYELWKEQNGRSLYSDLAIPADAIAATDNRVQVDHILPWSLSGDDSFVNKTLCWANENQHKKRMTPFQWLGENERDWQAFTSRVESCLSMKGRKKRNFLLKDANVLEEKFRSRNLNDTRYASRLLLNILKADYPGITVAARPGPLTDRLRRAWGIQSLKKTPEGDRKPDDRHHALDAVIVALTDQSRLQRLTALFQEAETRGLPTDWHGIGHLSDLFRDSGGLPPDFSALEQPWPGFRAEVAEFLQGVTVSRAERRRARGEAHAATIRQVKECDGTDVVFERKAVAALTEKDLDRIKDPERNAALVDSLRQWVVQGKPKDALPLSPKGDPIGKVRLLTNKKVDVSVRGGAAERGEMTRIDVFRKANKRGKPEYFLVPIYPHQVADRSQWPQPPNQAVTANKPEEEWPTIDASHTFLWSLYPLCWVEVQKADGEIIEGYFRGMSRNTGAILISPHQTNTVVREGIGAKTLASFRKFAVDRLGKRHEIEKETRTWHGEVCT